MVAEFPGAVVTVSHDRYLLDDTVNQIAELDRGAVTMWPGTYSAYAVAKELALQRQQRVWVTQQKEIARLEAAIARFELWASWVPNERHIRQARNKQRQIDQMDKVDRPVFERRKMALELRPAERGGQRIARLREISMAFDDDPVLLDATFDVYRRERLGVVGPNGAGKTVLGQILAGELEATAGERWIGPSIRIGYLEQGFQGQDPALTPVETVRKTKAMYEGEAVALLAKFLFRYDQMRTPIGSLSGGERTRLELCLLMLSGANCLILDEPTNHLDIESMEVLEGAVESFDGTAILISHDRYLLDRLCDRILEVRDGEVRSFDGGYDDWVAAKAVGVSVERDSLERIRDDVVDLPSLPSIGRVAGAGRAGEGGALRRPGVLGEAGPRLGRSGRGRADPRAGTRRPRWEPHGQDLHRRPQRRFPVRVVASHRLREPGHLGVEGRRAPAAGRLHRRREPVRTSREQADAGGARPLPAVPREGDQRAHEAPGDRGARLVRLGRRAPCPWPHSVTR